MSGPAADAGGDDDFAARLRSEGLHPSAWANGPGDRYAAHSHPYHKVLVVTSGSITFHLTDIGEDVDLATGDRLDLPAGTVHGATVGGDGVQCLEAHVAESSLGGTPRRSPRGW